MGGLANLNLQENTQVGPPAPTSYPYFAFLFCPLRHNSGAHFYIGHSAKIISTLEFADLLPCLLPPPRCFSFQHGRVTLQKSED